MGEVAKHATQAALELDNSRRTMERYIFTTDIQTISDIDPTAGQVQGGGPAEYSAFPYPLGFDKWPTSYPVPSPRSLNELGLKKPRFPKTELEPREAGVGCSGLVDALALPQPLPPLRSCPKAENSRS